MTRYDFLSRLGIRHPVIQAPMGGGFTPPELVAAVSNAGGLGSLGAPYLTPEQIIATASQIRQLTDKPFNVNLFAGGYAVENRVDPAPMLSLLGEIHAVLGLPAPVLPPLQPIPFQDQLEAVLEVRPAVFSFTFGIPDATAVRRLKAADIVILGTATTVDEAYRLADAGVDAIVAQGAEAGAHRGTFLGSFEQSMVPTSALVCGIRGVLDLPVIASGGLMDGADISRAMREGAAAAQLGTAFLTCPEAGTPAIHREAILAARRDITMITRAFSGRPARGLANEFMTTLARREEIILPFPLQNDLTRAMRAAAAKQGNAGFVSLWAGRGVTRARTLPATALVDRLVAEMGEASAA
jgi:nitronate monooxygenase